jgi:hypothetical protein
MLKYTTFFHLTEQFAHRLRCTQLRYCRQPPSLPASFKQSIPASHLVNLGHFRHCHRKVSGTSKTSLFTIHMYIASIMNYLAELQFLYSGLMWSDVPTVYVFTHREYCTTGVMVLSCYTESFISSENYYIHVNISMRSLVKGNPSAPRPQEELGSALFMHGISKPP